MNGLLLSLSLCAGVCKNIISKIGSGVMSGIKKILSVNVFTGAVALIVFACFGLDFSFAKNSVALFIVLAVLYGFFTVAAQTSCIAAVHYGDVSLCTMIYSSGFIIPTIFSAVYFNEELGALKIVGIALMLVSILIMNLNFERERSRSPLYLVFAFSAMICSGVIGILQKLFAHKLGSGGIDEYLFVSFACVLLFSLPFMLMLRKSDFESSQKTKLFLLFAIIIAICTVFNNKLNLYLSANMDGTVFFPIYNGGVVVFSSLLSKFIIKEKMSWQKYVGIIGGVASIILISLA